MDLDIEKKKKFDKKGELFFDGEIYLIYNIFYI